MLTGQYILSNKSKAVTVHYRDSLFPLRIWKLSELLVLLRLFAQRGEGRGVVDGELGEHLAVDLDASLLQAVHQLGVAQVVHPGAGVDAGDPQAAEVALLELAADVGVSEGAANLLTGGAILLGFCAKIALGELEYFTTLL